MHFLQYTKFVHIRLYFYIILANCKRFFFDVPSQIGSDFKDINVVMQSSSEETACIKGIKGRSTSSDCVIGNAF